MARRGPNSMLLNRGDRVVHRTHGMGRVTGADGDVVVVHMDRYDMRVSVPLSELQPVPDTSADGPGASSSGPQGGGGRRAQPGPPGRSKSPRAFTKSTPPTDRPSERPTLAPPPPPLVAPGEGVLQATRMVDQDRVALLQGIEALRFGVMPPVRLDSLTAGYQQMERWIKSRLPHEGTPQVSEISGPFGSGKSHASGVVRHVANKLEYLTAHVEVDGVATTLSDPAGLLHALWNTLQGPGFRSSTPLLHLTERVLRSVRALPRLVPTGADRFRENMQAIRFLERAGRLDGYAYQLDALLSSSGEYTANQIREQVRRDFGYSPWELTLRPMIGRLVAERPYDFVEALGGVASLARLAGFKGLVVTIDEFEVEGWILSARKRERVRDLLEVLGRYLRGETRHRPAPLAMFFATTGDVDTRSAQFIRALIPAQGNPQYSVRALNRRSRANLAKAICDLYREAYALTGDPDYELATRVESEVGSRLGDSDGTRTFIKTLVGLLDERHGPPASNC
jgi:hypothetical protein